MKEKNTAWILLVVSGLMEIVWAYTMKLSHGFTVLLPSVITIAILIISFFLLAKAVNTLGIRSELRSIHRHRRRGNDADKHICPQGRRQPA